MQKTHQIRFLIPISTIDLLAYPQGVFMALSYPGVVPKEPAPPRCGIIPSASDSDCLEEASAIVTHRGFSVRVRSFLYAMRIWYVPDRAG